MANAGITLTTGADTTLGDVIKTIQQQSDYRFFYDDELARHTIKTVDLKDVEVSDALKKLFDDTGLTYVIKDKVIYLDKAEKNNSTKNLDGGIYKVI